jgi:glycosyltransferase involved in cell wall biosynthesis
MDERASRDVSLVCTVRNEVATIGNLMRSIAAQTVRPREVIFVDGGSRDGTQLHIEWWHGRLGCPLRLIDAPGAGIARGRNIAIAATRAPIIAVTDAGVRLECDWLERLTDPFTDTTVNSVGGFFLPDARTTFEIAMGATVLPTPGDIDPSTFLPSSRSIAFRRAVWETVGGYPEWLDYCEDLVFDLRAREHCGGIAFEPDAIVHFRPRGSLRAFWHQYFRYARGDGRANLWAKRHAIRYATYASATTLLFARKRSKIAWPFTFAAALLCIRRPMQRLIPAITDLPPTQRAVAVAWVPIIRVVGDLAKMTGYPVGLVWRVRRFGWQWTWHDADIRHNR